MAATKLVQIMSKMVADLQFSCNFPAVGRVCGFRRQLPDSVNSSSVHFPGAAAARVVPHVINCIIDVARGTGAKQRWLDDKPRY